MVYVSLSATCTHARCRIMRVYRRMPIRIGSLAMSQCRRLTLHSNLFFVKPKIDRSMRNTGTTTSQSVGMLCMRRVDMKFETMALSRDVRTHEITFLLRRTSCRVFFCSHVAFFFFPFFVCSLLGVLTWQCTCACSFASSPVRSLRKSLKIRFSEERQRERVVMLIPLQAGIKFYGQWIKAK